MEGFWVKDSRERRGGGRISQGSRGSGETALVATRVLAKGECIGGDYLAWTSTPPFSRST